jgi:hypothetical protein
MVAYFIRRSGDDCAVIKLHSGDREEVVQDGLTQIAAEILCVGLIEDIPKPAALPFALKGAPAEKETTKSSGRRNARQLLIPRPALTKAGPSLIGYGHCSRPEGVFPSKGNRLVLGSISHPTVHIFHYLH